MILCDEDSLRSQREFLEARRLPVRKVRIELGPRGNDRQRDPDGVARCSADHIFHPRCGLLPAKPLSPSLLPGGHRGSRRATGLLCHAAPAAPRLSDARAPNGEGYSPAASSTGHETEMWSRLRCGSAARRARRPSTRDGRRVGKSALRSIFGMRHRPKNRWESSDRDELELVILPGLLQAQCNRITRPGYAAVSDLTTEILTRYPNPARMRTSRSLDT